MAVQSSPISRTQIADADLTEFVTQSFLKCAGLLESMEIISVIDRDYDDAFEILVFL